MSKRQNFALVVIDSADTTEAGRLALACKHHSSPRNTRKENLVQDISKYEKNTEQLIKAEMANNDKIFEQMKINDSLAEENESMVKVKVEGGDAPVNVNVADGKDQTNGFGVHNNHSQAETFATIPTPQQLELIMRLIKHTSQSNRQIMDALNADPTVETRLKSYDIANMRRRFSGMDTIETNTMHTFINKLENEGYDVRSQHLLDKEKWDDLQTILKAIYSCQNLDNYLKAEKDYNNFVAIYTKGKGKDALNYFNRRDIESLGIERRFVRSAHAHLMTHLSSKISHFAFNKMKDELPHLKKIEEITATKEKVNADPTTSTKNDAELIIISKGLLSTTTLKFKQASVTNISSNDTSNDNSAKIDLLDSAYGYLNIIDSTLNSFITNQQLPVSGITSNVLPNTLEKKLILP
ncbi:hypothetical protein BC941DRAFT_456921 [Chlamydoabsidia padenii]|nr:hypothetical protein BC941DRAFT_456921 [Chlamydoabsidia padenii]